MKPPQTPDLRKAIRAWCLYDWANSAYATTVMAAMYPPFFRSLAVAAGFEEHRATAAWGYIAVVALLIVAVVAPALGAIADHGARRRRFLGLFVVLGAGATACFPLNGDDTWRLAAVLFVLGTVGFAGGNVFYESLLPGIAEGPALDRISSRGYALGYLGGGLLLIVNAAWVIRPELFGFADAGVAVRASFASVAVWWAAFSVPLFRHVPEPPPAGARTAGTLGSAAAGLRRLAQTFRELRRYRQALLFLVAFWVYNDGIGTIIKMATAYGHEIGIGMTDLVGALVLTQLVGVPCTLLFGRLAGVTGAKRAILIALTVYSAVSVGGMMMTTPFHFYLLAIVVGTVQGGSQALSRSLFAAMVPRHRSAEFFGFYGASGKLAGIFGPLVFALVTDLTGTGRAGIFALLAFFVVGGLLLTRVDVDEGKAAARAAELTA